MRRIALTRRRKPVVPNPERDAWKTPARGYCQACSRPCWRLHRHHVCYQQHVRRAGGNEWALRNSMLLCETCHTHHHSAYRRVRIERIPQDALAFMVDLLGEEQAAAYLRRYYDTTGAA